MPPVLVGISLKMYFGHREATNWFARVADRIREHPGVTSGDVSFFVMPTYLQLQPAISALAGTPARVGAQDVATDDRGAFTGEVSAAELAEIGVALAEVGHSERRRLYGETDEAVSAKVAAALRNDVTPVVCVGESERLTPPNAAAATVAQLHRSLAEAPSGPIIVAYEPEWAIGATEAAPPAHISTVTLAIRAALDTDPRRSGSAVIYGGTAGPGLLTTLGCTVDGLFVGRLAHDLDNLVYVLDEGTALAATHSTR